MIPENAENQQKQNETKENGSDKVQKKQNEQFYKIELIMQQTLNQESSPLTVFVKPPLHSDEKRKQVFSSELDEYLIGNKGTDSFFPFGQERPLDLNKTQIPEAIYIDSAAKARLKKIAKQTYQKMIINLKICAGLVPGQVTSNESSFSNTQILDKLNFKADQFYNLCKQLKVGQTRSAILNMLQNQTTQMNQQSKQIESTIEEMISFCKEQGEKQPFNQGSDGRNRERLASEPRNLRDGTPICDLPATQGRTNTVNRNMDSQSSEMNIGQSINDGISSMALHNQNGEYQL